MEMFTQAPISPVFGLPRFPRSALSRPRIITRIDELLANNDLVLVRAPAGSGKTVSLAEWALAAGQSRNLSWITMDDRYADRVSFWREMIISAKVRIDPGQWPLLNDCLEALSAGSDVRTVLRRFAQLIPDTVVVIDRIDFVTDEDLFKDLIWVLVNCRGIQAVVSSRARNIMEAPTLALTIDVAVIDPEFFLLTLDETAELLAKRGLDLDAAELLSATGGHPLLTRATLASHDPDGTVSLGESAATAVRDFMDLSAVRSIDGATRDFMVRTSLPDSLTVALAQDLSGAAGATSFLDAMEDRGYGMWFRTGGVRRFRYIMAIRTHLLALAARMDPRETDRLTRIIIEEALGRHDPLGALGHAVRIRDLDLASQIACDHHMSLLFSQTGPVLEILQSVPLTTLRRHPALIMAMALCHNSVSTGVAKAIELFGVAALFARSYRSRIDPLQRLWMLTMESAALRFAGKLEPAIKLAVQSVQQFEESPLEVREQLAALEPTLYTQAVIALIHGQQFGAASELAAKAIHASMRSGSLPGIFLARGMNALACALGGNLVSARESLSWLCEARWPPGMLDGYWATSFRLAQAREAMDRQSYVEARGYLSLINDEMRTSEFWPVILLFDVLVEALIAGYIDPAPALESRIRRAHRGPVNSSGKVDLDCLRSTVHLVSGHPAKAATVLSHYPENEPRVQLMRARAALAAGEAERALAALDGGMNAFTPRMELHHLMLQAAAHLRLGSEVKAKERVKSAVEIMCSTGMAMTAALVPADDLPGVVRLARKLAPDLPCPVVLVPSAEDTPPLTPRELVVLRAISSHGPVAAVARHLGVSVNTVKSQIRSIHRKLDASTREEALSRARDQGLLEE